MRMRQRSRRSRLADRIPPITSPSTLPATYGPAPRPPRRRVGAGVLPDWLPAERLLTAVLVVVIVLATTAFSASPSGSRRSQQPAAGNDPNTTSVLVPASASGAAGDTSAASEASGHSLASTIGGTTGVAGTSGLTVTKNEPWARDADGNLLPANRIVAYYGNIRSDQMGVLGRADIDTTYARLMDQVAEWQSADPNTPVIPAWEIITSVANREAGNDGTFLTNVPLDTIQTYIDFATAHDMIVFLDIQVGARGVHDEVQRLMPLLKQPNVMLAVDPEFAVHTNEIPGQDYGFVTADELNGAQQTLSDVAAQNNLPHKLMLVHQFRYDMIHDKANINDLPDVELILHADGHGNPADKAAAFKVVVGKWVGQLSFVPGFKVFYQTGDPAKDQYNDDPVMTPDDILQLDPVPYYISYQ